MADPRDPRSLADREHASFRTDGTKAGVARKVVGLDGEPLGSRAEEIAMLQLLELRAIRRGLEILTEEDLGTEND